MGGAGEVIDGVIALLQQYDPAINILKSDDWKKTVMEPINVFDYEILAKERMAPACWDFYAGGSDDEVTMRANQSDFAHIRLRPRMLINVSQCHMNTSVLGLPVQMPILVAPTALHCLAHPQGECATAQGAGKAGTLMIVSTDATRTLEKIALAASGPLWFQLYTYPSLEFAATLVRRAEMAGYKAIVLTVDLPVMGNRERSRRHAVPMPPPPLVEANFAGIEMEDDDQEWVSVTWEPLIGCAQSPPCLSCSKVFWPPKTHCWRSNMISLVLLFLIMAVANWMELYRASRYYRRS